MEIYITSFNNIRYFTPNMIPISTAQGWPYWLYKSAGHKIGEYYLDKNNIMIGISEESFSCKDDFERMTEQCQKNCPYKSKVPNCEFMIKYYEHLKRLDFNNIIKGFEKAAEDVRKINNFEGEPIIVLLVYEAATCDCAERPCLQHWFKDNGYELKEWTRDLDIYGNIF